MALGEIGKQWANSHGRVKPGTQADVIDTTDGGAVVTLKFLGFEEGTLEGALQTLRTNGLNAEEIFPPGKWLGAETPRR